MAGKYVAAVQIQPHVKSAEALEKSMSKPQVILDIECYKNYFLAMFYSPLTDSYVWTEQYDGQSLNFNLITKIFEQCEIVTFNGNNYDLPVLSAAMRSRTTEAIREVSDMIILHDQKPWQIEKRYGKTMQADHVDLIEVAFGKSSLKIYGGRLGCKKLQDLPIEPDKILTRDEMTLLREYCKNEIGRAHV